MMYLASQMPWSKLMYNNIVDHVSYKLLLVKNFLKDSCEKFHQRRIHVKFLPPFCIMHPLNSLSRRALALYVKQRGLQCC